jgi:cation diffusion facilitator family transporter
MFILTLAGALAELTCGFHAHSQALVADGLYSFAEAICLVGVMFVLYYAHLERNQQKNNTFGYDRLELLFGLIQEVFLLSISLGIIVDALNHLITPAHVHDPYLMIALGIYGILVGFAGMVIFWGYHHDHDIEEEIVEKKRHDFLSWTERQAKKKRQAKAEQRREKSFDSPVAEDPALQDFTYGNVEIKQARVYATLHALCLHSFVC